MKRTAVGALAFLTLSACSSGSDGPRQPAVSAFAEGTCRTAAPDVLTIGREVRKLGDGKNPPSGPLEAMQKAQEPLDAIATGAEPTYQPALRKLVTAVGLVRFRAHVGSYVPSLGADVVTAYDGVLAVCTKPSS